MPPREILTRTREQGAFEAEVAVRFDMQEDEDESDSHSRPCSVRRLLAHDQTPYEPGQAKPEC
jgi:hypothetical protein